MRMSSLDLQRKVRECYPNSEIKEIKEIFIAGKGWIKHNVVFCETELHRIHLMKADKVNLFLFNENGMKCYPDYSIIL